ncbi:(Fe-S)-binding protein [Actinomadura sp. CNU-125]|uniref:(Fe-S)-binding protein n=1 Tax=Actinomadura sp. CNU-125 TaxID=1904961 RepID=UPI000A74FC0F|nr:heterodisulfide reductase-related iron-sulfur binding cluster [Actinomadura sp. CNU-125]
MTFRRWFSSHASPEGRHGDVVLFVDTFTDAFSPDVGRATVRVLEHAGYRVTVTERPVCCGITWISTGQLDGARAQARRTVRALLPHVRRGAKVVGMEPSCTGVLRSDAEELLDGVDAAAAREDAAATRTLAELLAETDGWTPPDLSGVSGVAQPHCHHHAVMGWRPDETLLRDAGATCAASAAAAGSRGTSASRRGTTTCRSPSPGTGCCPPSATRRTATSSSPTGSAAAPSSISSPTGRASTSPSSWPATCRISRRRGPGQAPARARNRPSHQGRGAD